MIIRTYQVDTEEHVKELDELVRKMKLGTPVESQKITPAQMAIGIGRPLSDEEWDSYFENFPNINAGKTGTEILETYRKK